MGYIPPPQPSPSEDAGQPYKIPAESINEHAYDEKNVQKLESIGHKLYQSQLKDFDDQHNQFLLSVRHHVDSMLHKIEQSAQELRNFTITLTTGVTVVILVVGLNIFWSAINLIVDRDKASLEIKYSQKFEKQAQRINELERIVTKLTGKSGTLSSKNTR